MNTPSLFDSYEIEHCRETHEGTEVCSAGDAQFCTLYGRRGPEVQAIGNFKTFEAAAEVYYSITGRPYDGKDKPISRLSTRSAEVAYQVLHSFQENSAYEDYRDGDETPFTDLEYWQMLQELYPLAHASVPEPENT